MNPLPAWQVARAEATRRAATRTVCRQCGTPILRGFDADVAAFTVTVNAEPINWTDEKTIRAATFDLIGRGTEAALWRRTERHRTMERRFPIHAEHQCDVQEPLAFGEAS